MKKNTYNPEWPEKYTIKDINRGKHLSNSIISKFIYWVRIFGKAAADAIRAQLTAFSLTEWYDNITQLEIMAIKHFKFNNNKI